nr:hypothetical protein [Tanacetum cinerariifolium]
MGDEHLDTILATESDKFIKSSVENLVPNPSESESEHECDVPARDDFTTFFNILFDADDDFSSKSLLNHDSSIISSFLKIDYLLDEFTGELIFLKSIPPGIDKADCDPEEEIRLIEKLLYDNSSPRPSEEFNSENSNAIIESFSISPILVEDSDPFMEEIDLFLSFDGSIPSGIDNDYSVSKGDNLFLERLLHDDSIPLSDTRDFSNVKGLKTVLNIQDEDEVVKSPRACHWKEHKITVPTPSDPTKHVADEEMDDSLERAATTATSLDAEQDITSLRPNPRKHLMSLVPKELVQVVVLGVNTPRSGEDSLKLNELMELCTKLQQRVLDLETTKTTQALKIDNLKRRVKKLKRRRRSRTHRLKRLYKIRLSARVESSEDKGLVEKDASKQGRILDINANEDIYLVNVHNDEDMFCVNDLDSDEVIVENVDVVEQAKEVVDDITLAKSLMEIKSEKPKAVKVVIQETEQGTTTTTPTIIAAASLRPKAKRLVIHEQEQAPTPIVFSQQPSQVKDKGKGKMVELEPMKKLSKKDQLMLDEELAFRL